MGRVQLKFMSYIPQCPQSVVGLYLNNAGPVLNKGIVPYLAQGVITMAGDFSCLPLSSSLIMKGPEVP